MKKLLNKVMSLNKQKGAEAAFLRDGEMAQAVARVPLCDGTGAEGSGGSTCAPM